MLIEWSVFLFLLWSFFFLSSELKSFRDRLEWSNQGYSNVLSRKHSDRLITLAANDCVPDSTTSFYWIILHLDMIILWIRAIERTFFMNGVLGSYWIVLYCYCYFTNVAVVLMNNEWILVLYLQKNLVRIYAISFWCIKLLGENFCSFPRRWPSQKNVPFCFNTLKQFVCSEFGSRILSWNSKNWHVHNFSLFWSA